MMEWFMCIYTRTLPWSSVLRVWDMFFCEGIYNRWHFIRLFKICNVSLGVKVLFRVGLVILKYSFMKPKTMKECPTMYESMEVLRHLHTSVTEENVLVPRVICITFQPNLFDYLIELLRLIDVEAAHQRRRDGTCTQESSRAKEESCFFPSRQLKMPCLISFLLPFPVKRQSIS
jgi:hypothetical protein